jgi:hypothetical protein
MCYCSRAMPQLLATHRDLRHFFPSGTGLDPADARVASTLPIAPRICLKCIGKVRVLSSVYDIAEDRAAREFRPTSLSTTGR